MNDRRRTARRMDDEGYLVSSACKTQTTVGLRREMLTVMRQGGWLVSGTDP